MNQSLLRGVAAGLLLGTLGCVNDGGDPPSTQVDTVGEPDQDNPLPNPMTGPPKPGEKPMPGETPKPGEKPKPGVEPDIPAPTAQALLAAADDCSDLLTRIQDDAIAKLKMQVELAKRQPIIQPGFPGGGARDAGSAAPPPNASPRPGAGSGPDAPKAPTDSAGGLSGDEGTQAPGPVASSDTNKQVADVDEADFVKVVQMGRAIYLLHGSTLQKLKSWPAAETAREGKALQIEGSPSEMFVTEQGKAVVFSTVWGYGDGYYPGGPYPAKPLPGGPVADVAPCFPGARFCGGGASTLKITVADVAGAEPKVERELYYDGSYVSSRRYAAGASSVVRAVVQAPSKFHGLFQPQIQYTDAWGRPYEQAAIASQLDEWQARTIASIRDTELNDWLPAAREAKAGKLVDLAPDCDSYYVPAPGLAGYGLTHVLSLDIGDTSKPVGGVTIVGAASTVYSNAQRLVLAQPDYRATDVDFGATAEQQTALHQFDLAGLDTKYVASGWVFGQLPSHNPQFGIDVTDDGTIRVATSGWVRKNKNAKPEQPAFWERTTENYVITAKASGTTLGVIAKSAKLGHVDERIMSARFLGKRAYVVTFRQTDPLIIVDVANPTVLPVLGEIEIPGFSQYIHPLDENHLVTFGQSASRGLQLQLFDVTNPSAIRVASTFDFGPNTYSDASHNHKALTFFEGVLAVPISGTWYTNRSQFMSGIHLVRADAARGFQSLGFVDHGRLYASNGAGVSCGVCDASGCYDYACNYAPEVRRGHFVRGESATYVYSFSHAGVLVHDLAALGRPVASLGLPAPAPSSSPWYGTNMTAPTTDAGVAPGPRVVDAGVVPAPPPVPLP
jgi:hypothetical protein